MKKGRLLFAVLVLQAIFAFGCSSNKQEKNTNPTETTENDDKDDQKKKDICGDKKVGENEKCDDGITEGTGRCPESQSDCDALSSNACETYTFQGEGCQRECVPSAKTCNAEAYDSCCPNGCNASTDLDCKDICGDGVVTGDETCDNGIDEGTGKCPESQSDCDALSSNACEIMTFVGEGCMRQCVKSEKLSCDPYISDGCCQPWCSLYSDIDCGDQCGDGFVSGDETCDTASPYEPCVTREACVGREASDACHQIVFEGEACTSVCKEIEVACQDGDGCCPSNCNSKNDSDCTLPTVKLGQKCLSNSQCAEITNGKCMMLDLDKNEGICVKDCTDDASTCSDDEFCTSPRWNSDSKYCHKICDSDTNCNELEGEFSCQPSKDSENQHVCTSVVLNAKSGTPCKEHSDCGPEGICNPEDRTGSNIGGFCDRSFPNNGPYSYVKCPSGSVATTPWPDRPEYVWCAKKCDTDDDCRKGEGYYCADFNGKKVCGTSPLIDFREETCQGDDASTKCSNVSVSFSCRSVTGGRQFCASTTTPIPESQLKEIGEPCTHFGQCKGGEKAACAFSQCVLITSSDDECPEGSSGASVIGMCVKKCEGDEDCASLPGSYCLHVPSIDFGFCSYNSTRLAEVRNVGGPCERHTDCGGTSALCITDGYQGGYCTAACNSNLICPPGSVCLPDGQGRGSYCYKRCEDATDCREDGYKCDTRLVKSYGYAFCLPK